MYMFSSVLSHHYRINELYSLQGIWRTSRIVTISGPQASCHIVLSIGSRSSQKSAFQSNIEAVWVSGKRYGRWVGWVSFKETIVANTELAIITCLQAPAESTFLRKAAPQPSNWGLMGPGLSQCRMRSGKEQLHCTTDHARPSLRGKCPIQ